MCMLVLGSDNMNCLHHSPCLSGSRLGSVLTLDSQWKWSLGICNTANGTDYYMYTDYYRQCSWIQKH